MPISVEDLRIACPGAAMPIDLGKAIPSYGANLPYLVDLACRKGGLQDRENPEYQTAYQRIYYRIYRRLQKLAKNGLLTLSKVDGLVFAVPTNRLYLVRQEQNSKKANDPANRPNREQCEEILQATGDVDPKAGIPPLYRLPARSKPQRIEAIKSYLGIRNPTLFVRPDPDHLNPDLIQALAPSENQFESYLEEVEDQVIILKKTNPFAPGKNWLTFPYTVRFNDQHKKIRNLKTYETGIDNSLASFEEGVFLTLTTDPLLWMGPSGMEFTRTITNKKTGEVLAKFNAVAKGKTLWHANRHESEAWRQYYEKLVHRFGWRVPYIRVVEFMENGLIHLHVLFFGIRWLDDFRKVAYDWGVTYGQGFNCQISRIRKRDGKWDWASKKDEPTDSDGKDPGDYLKKYLKKALFNTDGYSPYWVTNKRFFTMSQSLRYQEIIEAVKAKMERKTAGIYEFFGAVPGDQVSEAIARDGRRPRETLCSPLPVDQLPRTWTAEIHPDLIPFGKRRERQPPDKAPVAVKVESGGDFGAPATVDDAGPRAGGDVNPATGRPYSLADFL